METKKHGPRDWGERRRGRSKTGIERVATPVSKPNWYLVQSQATSTIHRNSSVALHQMESTPEPPPQALARDRLDFVIRRAGDTFAAVSRDQLEMLNCALP
jgi:hypothetical protein